MGKRFWYQDFDDCGYNFRMTDVQAAVGLVQLKKLDALNQKRIDVARQLDERLAGIPGLTLPARDPNGKHVYHLYPVLVDAEAFGLSKEDLIHAMYYEKGIKLGIHYIPLHYSTAFQKRGFKKGSLPVAESLAERLITLPIHPRWTQEGLDYLVESFKALGRS